MVEFKFLFHRNTVIFRVKGSGWVMPQMLGLLLEPGNHLVYEEGVVIGYTVVFNLDNVVVHIERRPGQVA